MKSTRTSTWTADQKAIVIGAGGLALKQVGISPAAIEDSWTRRCTWTCTSGSPGLATRPRQLRKLGF